LTACIEAVTAAQVRDAFEPMLAAPMAVAIAGKVPVGASQRVRGLVETQPVE